jgi:hypothetical protein
LTAEPNILSQSTCFNTQGTFALPWTGHVAPDSDRHPNRRISNVKASGQSLPFHAFAPELTETVHSSTRGSQRTMLDCSIIAQVHSTIR